VSTSQTLQGEGATRGVMSWGMLLHCPGVNSVGHLVLSVLEGLCVDVQQGFGAARSLRHS